MPGGEFTRFRFLNNRPDPAATTMQSGTSQSTAQPHAHFPLVNPGEMVEVEFQPGYANQKYVEVEASAGMIYVESVQSPKAILEAFAVLDEEGLSIFVMTA